MSAVYKNDFAYFSRCFAHCIYTFIEEGCCIVAEMSITNNILFTCIRVVRCSSLVAKDFVVMYYEVCCFLHIKYHTGGIFWGKVFS